MLSLTFEKVAMIGEGAWLTSLSPADVRRLGNSAPPRGERSVLAVEAPVFDKERLTLTVRLDAVSALSIGRQNETVLVDLNCRPSTLPIQPTDLSRESVQLDSDFLSACRTHLSEEKVDLISILLKEVRKSHGDRLVEGEGRKWTTSPSNFMAITIQNRNQQFLVSVKADPSRYSLNKIELKRSRSPYCEFHLSSPTQLQEAIKVILASSAY